MSEQLIGHDDIKSRIKVTLSAAQTRNACIPHMLLAGAAGCGKTTTARWLSKLGAYEFMAVSPLSLKSRKSVYELMEKLNTEGYNAVGDRVGKIKPTILFFDEIHQMPVVGQEVLGMAMERFDLETDEQNKLIWLPYFAVIGATTDDGILTKPFRDRFKSKFIYKPYTHEDMCKIINFHAAKNKIVITKKAVRAIADRSRGVPRTMVNYLESIRDFMIANGACMVTSALVESTFKAMGIDATGLNPVDITILKMLYDAKTPIGLENLAIVSNESAKTISKTIEPYLIRMGLMVRTGKGRLLTAQGRQYLEEHGHLDTGSSTAAPQKKLISVSYSRR